ncbi:MAG: non-heme iron oxygenase ferredoxin subunit [Actinomycetota bacterium]|nr:non-heme iron oxygenase ferredoxin subunit [Actinomycetota bacterium]
MSAQTLPTWVRVCSVGEVANDSAIRVEVGDVPIAVVKSDDVIYAIYDICSHAEVSLSEGDVDGTTLECWLHGSRFDLHSGRPTGLPATKPVPVYPVKIEGDDVFVAVTES